MSLAGINRPERLDFLAMAFACRSAGGFRLDNPYSDLHGGFGLMLHAAWPLVYQELFGAQADSASVRAYVLRPGPALAGALGPGEAFSFELLLYGPAVRHAAACAEALAQLGINGLTPARHRFAVEAIERLSPTGRSPLWTPADGWRLGNLAPVAAAELLERPFPADRWQLQLLTPLAIKSGNQLLRAAPAPTAFFERLLGRAQLLATQQSGGPLLDGDSKRALLAAAGALQPAGADCRWQELTRYSARQRQRSEFGGLLGSLAFAGSPGPLSGWLHLAPWLHVGSKTSFGFGCCRAIFFESAAN